MDTTSAQAILDKIIGDARQYAEDAVNQARERAQALRREADERQKARVDETSAQAAREADQAAERMRRMAGLEERKDLLRVKREVMDEAFDSALSALRALPDKRKREYFMRAVLQCAEGGERLAVGSEQSGWYDEAFLQQVNADILKRGVNAPLSAAKEPGTGCGPTLLRDGAQISLTFESAVHTQRLSLEADAARALFQDAR